MDKLMLFTDGSVNTRSKIGFGAYLAVSDRRLSPELLREGVKVRRFEQTSSTKLELQTFLWALNDIKASDRKIIVCTDSQNIVELQRRRGRLEKNDYRSKRRERLGNAELYQKFFRLIDQMDCEFLKVSGHTASKQKDDIDKLFALVDTASRKALREDSMHPIIS